MTGTGTSGTRTGPAAPPASAVFFGITTFSGVFLILSALSALSAVAAGGVALAQDPGAGGPDAVSRAAEAVRAALSGRPTADGLGKATVYRPRWDFSPMSGELEAIRDRAEDLSDAGRDGDASDVWGRLAEGARAAYGKDDARTLAAMSRRARARMELGDAAFSERKAAGEAVKGLSAALGEGSAEALFARETSAFFVMADGNPEDAGDLLRGALAASEASLGPLHPQTLSLARTLGICTALGGDVREALRILGGLPRVSAEALGESHPETAESWKALGWVLEAAGDARGSAEALLQAYGALSGAAGPEDPAVMMALGDLAEALLSAGEPMRAWELLESWLGSLPEGVRAPDAMLSGLAAACGALGDHASARSVCQGILADMEVRGDNSGEVR
ncbi:MAG: tetratricopeptide repeat protein [Deltaproteobacteria bacterium]|jgi:tetratricopeptide (TPR) repeat protein|nr:tetratricopeptide repeat protein [Deltaproteobacteria bacterium]